MQNEKQISTFPKSERLNSRKIIEKLFDRNNPDIVSFLSYPYRVVMLSTHDEEEGFPEILISVSKKRFKKAVDRNRIKRLTREGYRVQKIKFPNKTYLGLVYIGKELPDLDGVKKSIATVLSKLRT